MKNLFYVGPCLVNNIPELLSVLKNLPNVIVLSSTPQTIDGIQVITFEEYETMEFDIIIIYRFINFFIYATPRAKLVYFWLQDILAHPLFNNEHLPNNALKLMINLCPLLTGGIICTNKWHANIVNSMLQAPILYTIIPTFIEPNQMLNFENETINFVHLDPPNASLLLLITNWSKILQRHPKATLVVYNHDLPAQYKDLVGPQMYFKKADKTPLKKGDIIVYINEDNNPVNITLEKAIANQCLIAYHPHPSLNELIGTRGIQFTNVTQLLDAIDLLIENKELYSRKYASDAIKQWTQLLNNTPAPVTPQPPSTLAPVTQPVSTLAPVTQSVSTLAPVTQSVSTLAPVTQPVSTLAPVTQPVSILAPVTQPVSAIAPVTQPDSIPAPVMEKKSIGLLCNWSNNLANEWKRMVPPNFNFNLVNGRGDYNIVINGCDRAPESEDIHLSMEPSINRTHFSKVWAQFPVHISRNMLEWSLSKNWTELAKSVEKYKTMSAIVSGLRYLPGHVKRHEIVKALDDFALDFKFDIYGKHQLPYKNYIGPLQDKDSGVFPYKYHLAVENCRETGYFTEKIADGLLAECLVFYWGAPDILNYIDARAIIVLDLNDIKKSVETIINAVKNNEWEKRIQYIRLEKWRMLNCLSMFPTINRYLSGRRIHSNIITRVVNLQHRFDRWIQFTTRAAPFIESYERFDAVYGKELKLTDNIKHLFGNRNYPQKNPYNGHLWNVGAIGCALSHYYIWQQTTRITLVLEDDIVFCENFDQKYYTIVEYLLNDPDWDLCFLGYLDDVDIYSDTPVATINDTSIIRFNPQAARKNGGGTFGYIISPRGAKRLVDLANKYGIPQPIDWFMIEMFSELVAFKVNPHLIKTIGADTDIQTETMKLL